MGLMKRNLLDLQQITPRNRNLASKHRDVLARASGQCQISVANEAGLGCRFAEQINHHPAMRRMANGAAFVYVEDRRVCNLSGHLKPLLSLVAALARPYRIGSDERRISARVRIVTPGAAIGKGKRGMLH
jgi:hypothetical protein